MADRLWWQDGVIYQIYPRSFMDSNGDGIGDLAGIRQRLDHLVWLGVDAIWLSPCYPSPMADFGYDVADYCDVDPRFGTLDDLDGLIADAHRVGIRVILDWVPNHTSDQHPWFLESRADRHSAKRDWYVWRDAKSDGSPPNNWMSIFGGGAWTWDQVTQQFYLHSFLAAQPDLNWRSPQLVAAMHDVLRFWLDRGVDGFRIDVIHAIAKDPELRDNPLIPDAPGGYFGQQHRYDQNHPDVHSMLRGIRSVLDEYDARMAVGEVYLFDPQEVGRYYGAGDELHLAFNFSFLRSTWSASAFATEIERFEAAVPAGCWPDVVLSNHDVSRHATRYDDARLGEARTRVAAVLLLTLRGTPFLYYGEEIGMRDVPIPSDRLMDPVARNIHPRVGRDPERTPMQWDGAERAGFSTGEPWLPIGSDAGTRNVESQLGDRASLLHLYRGLIRLRRSTPALRRGSYRRLDAPGSVLAFERSLEGSRALIALNFGGEEVSVDLGGGDVALGIRTGSDQPIPDRAGSVQLGPSEALVLVLA